MKDRRRTQQGSEDGKRVRVAIIGGGCAGMAAAWHLSQQTGYEIHVYERSWRLGGKGASVRNAEGRILDHGLHVWLGYYENAFRMMRECYEEVNFHKWGPDREPPNRLAHRRIEDAFFPEQHIGVVRPPPHGDWVAWSGYFPPAEGLPGTKLDLGSNPFTLANYLLRCFDLLKTLILSVIGTPRDDAPGRPRPDLRHDEIANLDFSDATPASLQVIIERMARLLRNGSLVGAALLLQSVAILERWLQSVDDFVPQAANSALKLAQALANQTRRLLQDFVTVDNNLRMKTEIIDIVLTTVVGLFRDRLLFKESGLDAINHSDYRNWLRQNGATYTSLHSRYLTGNYDFAFAYLDGDRGRPALAAGVALRGALRMLFTYRGAMFWLIRSGMGDAVFAPLYKVLLMGRRLSSDNGRSRTGLRVKFHFLHELEAVGFDAPSEGVRYVSSLKFRTSGDPSILDRCGAEALDECGCWPDKPSVRFEEALKSGISSKELVVGQDFDSVIFALGVDDFKTACLEAASFENDGAKLPSKWQTMCAEVKTVATQSAQVWLKQDLHELGWHRGSGIFSALERSFDTWADMTHTLATERAWRSGMSKNSATADMARSVVYFCGMLPESIIKKVQMEVRGRFRRELLVASHQIVPPLGFEVGAWALELIRSIAQHRLDFSSNDELLQRIQADLSGPLSAFLAVESRELSNNQLDTIENLLIGSMLKIKVASDLDTMLTKDMQPAWPAAFSAHSTAKDYSIDFHVQASFGGSDRYTLSLPGSISHRISPLERSVENMSIAGDWTSCGLDSGCVEAAVMSGMLAAHAISGKPELQTIIGYDHP